MQSGKLVVSFFIILLNNYIHLKEKPYINIKYNLVIGALNLSLLFTVTLN